MACLKDLLGRPRPISSSVEMGEHIMGYGDGMDGMMVTWKNEPHSSSDLLKLKPNKKFCLKPGMKTRLLQQVAEDDPKGMGSYSKGWEVVVKKLLENGGPEWKGLTARLAREKVRTWITEWKKNSEAGIKTEGGENESLDDATCHIIYELWVSRKACQDNDSDCLLKPKSKFVLKPGMKTTLLQQVAVDNPEGMAGNIKGWCVVVKNLYTNGGPEWEGLTARWAREKVRTWISDWKEKNNEAGKNMTWENESEDDYICREIYELWAARSRSKVEGEEIRQKALPGLNDTGKGKGIRPTDIGEYDESEDDSASGSVKRRRIEENILDYLQKSKEKELEVREKEVAVREKEVELERARVRLLARQIEIQQVESERRFRIQQQQMEMLMQVIGKLHKK